MRTMTSKYHVTSFFTTWNWRSVCRQAGLFLKTRKDIIYIVKVLSSIKEYKASDPIGELYYQMTLTIQTRKDIIHIAKYFLAHPKSKASDPIDKFYYQMNLILQMVVEQCGKLGVQAADSWVNICIISPWYGTSDLQQFNF